MNDSSAEIFGWTVGSTAYEHVDEICSLYGKKAVIIGGKKAIGAAADKIYKSCRKIKITAMIWCGAECTMENIGILSELDEVRSADMIFGVGGGKALDICKCLSILAHKPMFSFPTVASNFSCCSRFAYIYDDYEDEYEHIDLEKTPVYAFLDTQILSSAPTAYLRHGIHEAIAMYVETQIAVRKNTFERMKSPMTFASHNLDANFDIIYRHCSKAYADNCRKKDSQDFRETIISTMIFSGMNNNMLWGYCPFDVEFSLSYTLSDVFAFPELFKYSKQDMLLRGTVACLLYDGQIDLATKLEEIAMSIDSVTKLYISDTEFNRLTKKVCDTCAKRKSNIVPDLERLRNILMMMKPKIELC